MIDPNIKIDVKKLMLAILQQKPITKRFNLPMTQEQVKDYLKAFMMAEVTRRQMIFVENNFLDKQINLMAEWLTTSDHRFCALFCGQCGNGKSTMLKAFQQLLCYLHLPNPYGETYGIQIVDAKYIAYLCKKEYPAFLKLADKEMLGIDDMGTEPQEIMDFGNIMTPVIDLLTKRYDKQLFTIITTNLTPDGIKERYGERIVDRFREMSFRIVFENRSYREI